MFDNLHNVVIAVVTVTLLGVLGIVMEGLQVVPILTDIVHDLDFIIW